MGLSKFSGCWCVGSRDIQWCAGGLASLTRKSSEVDPDKHLVGRIYYPSTEARGDTKDSGSPHSSSWLSSIHEASGFGSFLFFSAPNWQKYTVQPLFAAALWVFGKRTHVQVHKNAALAPAVNGRDGELLEYPVIIFSHGVGGTRGTYSVLCAELASQGYVVLAVEHTDGTASSVHCAGKGGWRYYSGFGKGDVQHAKLTWRMREVATAARVLEALNKGTLDAHDCHLSGEATAASFLRGKLNLKDLALVGHSFGGATVTAAAAVDLQPRAVVALDPYWPAVPTQSPALDRWKTHTPLLVIGSDAWNTPYNDEGDIVCGKDLQQRILKATHSDGKAGGGALLLVIKQSSHDTFSDLPVLFSQFSWILAKLGFVTKLEPEVGMAAISSATLAFLFRHLQSPRAPLIPKVILDTMAQHKTSDSPPSDNSLAAVGRGVHIFSNSSDQWEVVPSPCQIDGQQGPWETVNRQAGKRDVAASGAASASSKPSPGSGPGQVMGAPEGAEPAAAEQPVHAPQPAIDRSDIDLLANGSTHQSLRDGQPLQGGRGGSGVAEAEKLAVGVRDEDDMWRLLGGGDLAAIVQLHG